MAKTKMELQPGRALRQLYSPLRVSVPFMALLFVASMVSTKYEWADLPLAMFAKLALGSALMCLAFFPIAKVWYVFTFEKKGILGASGSAIFIWLGTIALSLCFILPVLLTLP